MSRSSKSTEPLGNACLTVAAAPMLVPHGAQKKMRPTDRVSRIAKNYCKLLPAEGTTLAVEPAQTGKQTSLTLWLILRARQIRIRKPEHEKLIRIRSCNPTVVLQE